MCIRDRCSTDTKSCTLSAQVEKSPIGHPSFRYHGQAENCHEPEWRAGRAAERPGGGFDRFIGSRDRFKWRIGHEPSYDEPHCRDYVTVGYHGKTALHVGDGRNGGQQIDVVRSDRHDVVRVVANRAGDCAMFESKSMHETHTDPSGGVMALDTGELHQISRWIGDRETAFLRWIHGKRAGDYLVGDDIDRDHCPVQRQAEVRKVEWGEIDRGCQVCWHWMFGEVHGAGAVGRNHAASEPCFPYLELLEIGVQDNQIGLVAGGERSDISELPVGRWIPCRHRDRPYRFETGVDHGAENVVDMPTMKEIMSVAIIGGEATAAPGGISDQGQKVERIPFGRSLAQHEHHAGFQLAASFVQPGGLMVGADTRAGVRRDVVTPVSYTHLRAHETVLDI